MSLFKVTGFTSSPPNWQDSQDFYFNRFSPPLFRIKVIIQPQVWLSQIDRLELFSQRDQ
jgi:hypothetical protein